MSRKRRVVITGIGAVTPLGQSFAATWSGIAEGRIVAGPVQAFDASLYDTRIAYEVAGFRFDPRLVREDELAFLSRCGQLGVQAASEALAESRLTAAHGAVDPARLQVCLGVGMNSPDFAWYDDVFVDARWQDPSVGDLIRYFPDQLSAVVARLAGAQGGTTTIHTACASSGQALGEAFEAVAHGEADVVLTGGSDSMISPYSFAGFSLLGALSKRNDEPRAACRPFDRARDGFVLGEGATMLVFEELEHAKRRAAPILGEVVGYGITESAYRITDLHPEGVGPIEAMRMALDDAGIAPSAVGYVNAHGTSTPLNDRIEALAIQRVFGDGKAAPLVSSTKSMTGHMISAAGAIEFALCVKALAEQRLPPSLNVVAKDAECPIQLTAGELRPHALEYALSNSVGFGGSNTALIARRVVP
jgi:3-oxoacyl-[acyl-carrier-protein] synthase II